MSVVGMNAETGAPLGGLEHLFQSITDILTTPIGTRVQRREYGSRIPSLVDRPMEPALRIELYAAVVEALVRWEPRFRLKKIAIDEAGRDGRMVMTLTGIYLVDGQEVTTDGLVL